MPQGTPGMRLVTQSIAACLTLFRIAGEGRSVGLLCLFLFHVIGDNKQLDNPAGVAPERSIRVATSWELGSEERSRVCVLVVDAESLGKGLCTLQVCALTTLRTLFCDDFFFIFNVLWHYDTDIWVDFSAKWSQVFVQTDPTRAVWMACEWWPRSLNFAFCPQAVNPEFPISIWGCTKVCLGWVMGFLFTFIINLVGKPLLQHPLGWGWHF